MTNSRYTLDCLDWHSRYDGNVSALGVDRPDTEWGLDREQALWHALYGLTIH